MSLFSTYFGTISVKDPTYGAVGDGSHDDTAAIQAAFNAAWGNYTTDHLSPFSNKSVFFPAGNYKVTGPLYISQASGGRVFGVGAFATQILFQGSANQGNVIFVTPNDVWTPVFCLNRVQNFEFDGISLVCDLASTGISPNMIGVYMDQKASGTANTICSVNSFKNMTFANFHIGVLGGLIGSNCENMQFYECNFTQCRLAGARTGSQNCLNWAAYGGSGVNCGSAGTGVNTPGAIFSCPSGGFQTLSNIAFDNGIHANITGVSAGTGGVIRLALNDALTNLWATGYYVKVSRVTGTGAGDVNGIWQLTTVDSNHIDLQGTTFNGAHSYSGGDVWAAYAYDVFVGSAPIAIIGGSSESQLGINAGSQVTLDGVAFRPTAPDSVWIFGNGGPVVVNGCQYGPSTAVSSPPPVIMDCQNNTTGIFNGLSGGTNADLAVFKSFGPAGAIYYNGPIKTGTGQIGISAFVGFLGDIMLNTSPMTIANLPAASVAFKNTVLIVTDCDLPYTAANIGTVAVHTVGTNVVPVRCLDGATWTIG